MEDYLDRFDAVYSVSDLHIGGAEDFQILDKSDRLARFIDNLATCDIGRVALVLNGDVIDALAEDGYRYITFDESEAVRLIERIMNDAAFVAIWDALAGFVAKPNRDLILVAGNHDIELGLPVTQRLIRSRLAASDRAAAGRIQFSGRGAGYSCAVGGARAFFTHGNELDRFNKVDNEKLGQLALAQNAGRRVDRDAWVPNFGTRLVVDVMNEIKAQYPFVDLLKPQSGAIFALLLLLGRDVLRHVDWGDLGSHARSYQRSRSAGGDLLKRGLDESTGAELAELTIDDLLGQRLQARADLIDLDTTEDDLLDLVDTGGADDLDMTRRGGADDPDDLLGWVTRIRGLFGDEEDKMEALRDALLDWRDKEPGFGQDTITQPDDMSRFLEEREASADFTVAGHTHRARSIDVRPGKIYLNSGTWIRILDVPTAALESADHFRPLWEALNAGSMAALDEATVETPDGTKPLMLDFATAVEVRVDDVGVTGQLLQIDADGTATPVPNSQHTVAG